MLRSAPITAAHSSLGAQHPESGEWVADARSPSKTSSIELEQQHAALDGKQLAENPRCAGGFQGSGQPRLESSAIRRAVGALRNRDSPRLALRLFPPVAESRQRSTSTLEDLYCERGWVSRRLHFASTHFSKRSLLEKPVWHQYR